MQEGGFTPSSPKRPIWIMHGTADMTVPFADAQTFVNELMKVGWPVTFTPIQGAPNNWLWQAAYGHTNDDLWAFFESHPAN